ncbi:MAG TPA: siphovirus Gp157 family protein, partial [Saccharofermentans sp.]|nr:siphovirus Gp157 family protein [Saccharofermentans sp.]
KKVMQMAMETAGEKKVKGQIFTISIQANPESVVLDESYIENIPPKYLKVKDPEIDKAKLKEDLKNGVNLEGIAHLEQTESLRIR